MGSVRIQRVGVVSVGNGPGTDFASLVNALNIEVVLVFTWNRRVQYQGNGEYNVKSKAGSALPVVPHQQTGVLLVDAFGRRTVPDVRRIKNGPFYPMGFAVIDLATVSTTGRARVGQQISNGTATVHAGFRAELMNSNTATFTLELELAITGVSGSWKPSPKDARDVPFTEKDIRSPYSFREKHMQPLLPILTRVYVDGIWVRRVKVPYVLYATDPPADAIAPKQLDAWLSMVISKYRYPSTTLADIVSGKNMYAAGQLLGQLLTFVSTSLPYVEDAVLGLDGATAVADVCFSPRPIGDAYTASDCEDLARLILHVAGSLLAIHKAPVVKNSKLLVSLQALLAKYVPVSAVTLVKGSGGGAMRSGRRRAPEYFSHVLGLLLPADYVLAQSEYMNATVPVELPKVGAINPHLWEGPLDLPILLLEGTNTVDPLPGHRKHMDGQAHGEDMGAVRDHLQEQFPEFFDLEASVMKAPLIFEDPSTHYDTITQMTAMMPYTYALPVMIPARKNTGGKLVYGIKMGDLIRKSSEFRFYMDAPLTPTDHAALVDKYLVNDFPLRSPAPTTVIPNDSAVPFQSTEIPQGLGVLTYSMDLAAFTPRVAQLVKAMAASGTVQVACRVLAVAKCISVVNVYIAAMGPQ